MEPWGKRAYFGTAGAAVNIEVDLLAKYVARLRALNPKLIYCSISGFRSGSGYESLPSFDYIHEAMSGVMSMTGYEGEQQIQALVTIALVVGLFQVATGLLRLG